MAAKLPFLPLFFGDLLASTALWSGEERALYVLLLAYQWTAGPIPKEPEKLARMTQYDPKRFKILWKTVGEKFSTTGAGLVNSRLEQHRVKAQQVSERNQERAKTAAEHRWASHRGDAQSNAPSIAAQNAIQSNPSYPNQEKESEDQNGPSRNRKAELDRLVAVTAQGRKIKEST